jgi:siderophore ferric iron reductase
VTARNYLFAESQDDAALTRFIAAGAKVTGFLKGAPGGHLPGWHRVGLDNTDFLRTLYARLEESYPSAGQPFYAVRLWTNIMWQPAYLAAIGVHVHGALPDLRRLSQSRQNLDINGYRLEPAPQRRGTTEELIALAGAELRAMADTVLAEINTVTKLKRIPALRLLTDRMLGIMVRLGHYQPGLTLEQKQNYCDLWLSSMGLTGHGALETLRLHTGEDVLIIARKGCCLDYLAFPDTYCSSCPKQDDTVRLARQRKVAEDEQAAAG